MQAKEYRPDIDVLRAIAVLAVIFYHAHIPFFNGGYVGVSIFFVISGYLITGIIKRKLESGTFSFLEFYENRVRRILPALVAVILFFVMLYYFLGMVELFNLQRSVRRAIFGLANFFFYANTDYFDPVAETMPLLHTWSLGVEEQFYFIFPLLLFLLYYYVFKINEKKLIIFLFVLWACSFVFSALFVLYDQKFTFYMLPTRAWELLCGSLLAYTAWTPAGQKGKSLCILAGLGLMFSAIVFQGNVLFPGFWALPPCLGAVLYIAGGTGYTFTNRANIIHLLTNNKALVFTGVISYSLYLWHWPVLVFYSNFPFYKKITLADAGILIPVIFIIAYLSWRFVEKPVRQNPFFKNRKRLWTLTILCMASVFCMATYMRYSKNYELFSCTKTAFKQFSPENVSDSKIPVDFIFIGDSHRQANEGLFQKFAEKYHLTGITANVVLKNSALKGRKYKHLKLEKDEWDKLEKIYKEYSSKNLFIIFRYTQKLTGKDRYYSLDKEAPLVYLPDKKLSPKQGFLQSMRDTLDEAYSYGFEHIYIQCPVPEPKDNIPHKVNITYSLLGYTIEQLNEKLGETAEEYQERNADIFETFAQLKKEYPQIEFVDISSCLLNPETKQYKVMNEKELFYYDDDHLSLEGTMQYYDAYDKIFAKIAKEKAQ